MSGISLKSDTSAVQCQVDAGDGRWCVAELPAEYVEGKLADGFEIDGPWAVSDGGALRVPKSFAAKLVPTQKRKRVPKVAADGE